MIGRVLGWAGMGSDVRGDPGLGWDGLVCYTCTLIVIVIVIYPSKTLQCPTRPDGIPVVPYSWENIEHALR